DRTGGIEGNLVGKRNWHRARQQQRKKQSDFHAVFLFLGSQICKEFTSAKVARHKRVHFSTTNEPGKRKVAPLSASTAHAEISVVPRGRCSREKVPRHPKSPRTRWSLFGRSGRSSRRSDN